MNAHASSDAPSQRLAARGGRSVDAIASLGARVLLLGALSGLGAAGCVVTQDLGAPPSPMDAGPAPSSRASAAASDGFLVAIPALPVTEALACPIAPPANLQPCARTDSAQCTYGAVLAGTCGWSCACGVEGKWRCVAAPCSVVNDLACDEGRACSGDVSCYRGCELGRCGRACQCTAGKLRCKGELPAR